MAIKYNAHRREYVGLSSDDKSIIATEGSIIYYTDTENHEILHDGNWFPYITSVDGTLNTSPIALTTLIQGNLPLTGSAQQLDADTACKNVTVQAHPDNTGYVYIGNANTVSSSVHMFVLSKGKPKTYNLLKDKPNRWAGSGTFGTNSERQKDGTIKERGSFIVPEFSYRNNIWKINNGYGYSSEDDIAHKHPAIFPEQLAQDHIWTWSNEGDIVYDCFGGSGTTAKMAHKLKRNWILSEISSEYVQIAEKRIAPYLAQTLLF